MRERIPGIALAVITAAVAYCVATALPDLQVGAAVWAILFGSIARTFIKIPSSCMLGLKLCEKPVLEVAIILLGAGLSISSLAGLDLRVGAVVLAGMILVILAGSRLARWAGLSSSSGFLLGVGSAICGAAAIASVAPLITKEKSETALSIGVVNIVGFAVMLILPWVAVRSGIGTEGSAFLLGGALPAVGHAVGAGYAAGTEIGALAMAVKMGRVLFLIPLILGCSLWAARSRDGSVSMWHVIPWFVPGFILAVGLRGAGAIPLGALPWIAMVGKAALTMAMAALGYAVDLKAVRKHGPGALVFGTVLILMQTLIVGVGVLLILKP